MSGTRIGGIGNSYGHLAIKTENYKYYWAITCEASGDDWEEIPQNLFTELFAYEINREKINILSEVVELQEKNKELRKRIESLEEELRTNEMWGGDE